MARISVLCSDLERNALYTPWMFTGAMRLRHEVELLGPKPRRIWPPAEGELEPAHVLPAKNPLLRNLRQQALDATVAADLVYAFKAHPASFGLGLWLRHRRRMRLAVHLCDWDGGYFSAWALPRRAWYAARALDSPGNELYFRFFERLTARADLLTVSTSALQRRFGGSVVRQGVDNGRFSPERFPRDEARSRIGVDEGIPLVVFVGTPALHKGLMDLVAAFRALTDDVRGKLLIVGTPPDAESARALANRSGRGVECRLSVPFDEAPWYVAASDVVCVPQRPGAYAEHQLPAKILHSMALGACLLTTDVGDAQEILGGHPAAGRVIPPADTTALKEALSELLHDASVRGALGTEARARAERLYSWQAMARDLDRLFGGLGLDG